MTTMAGMKESVTTKVKTNTKYSVIASQFLMNKELPEEHSRN